jgi:hypothetical protein
MSNLYHLCGRTTCAAAVARGPGATHVARVLAAID